ncbi:unnamed protein product [Brassica rapa subsp. trilocularis]
MATQVDPPNGVKNQGNHYVLIKPIGRGAYGETNERVAIKKIHNYIHSANFLHRDLKPANKYIESLPYSQPQAISFSRLYPNSHVLALICFRSQKMLVLDPPKRISVTEGLQHPYLAVGTFI